MLLEELQPLAAHYDVVVANPPYMGSSSLGSWMSAWVKKRYAETCRDLCTCFIERGFALLKPQGYSAMVTMESWMFLSSFEKMRKRLLREHSIATMVYMNHMVMRIAFNTCATVFKNQFSNAPGIYTQVYYEDLDETGIPIRFPSRHKSYREKQIGNEARCLEALADPECGWFYRRSTKTYEQIPGRRIGYWISGGLLNAFATGKPLGSVVDAKQGLATADNDRFLRLWWEVSNSRASYHCASIEESVNTNCRWFPYNKGGDFRKWYGHFDYLVNWENDGQEIRGFKDSSGKQRSAIRNPSYYFKPSITWTDITSSGTHFRYRPAGSLYDVKGMSCFPNTNQQPYILGFCNSSTVMAMQRILSPTMSTQIGEVSQFPIIEKIFGVQAVSDLVWNNVDASRSDWDSSEVSWDYRRHPLV